MTVPESPTAQPCDVSPKAMPRRTFVVGDLTTAQVRPSSPERRMVPPLPTSQQVVALE